MLNRRALLGLCCGTVVTWLVRPAFADTAGDRAASFVKGTVDRILAAMRATGSPADRRKVLGPLIDQAIDVDGVAKFCLGRYWRTATPDQQVRYTKLFHEVLIGNITSKLGEYQEVKMTVGRTQQRDETEVVSTIIERPNNPPTSVDWVVVNAETNPKVIDVIAEETSLRITQRSDYASFLSHNNNDVEKLITAMNDQLAQN
jgi:phospholipid transport system substrate-binding protein